MTRRRTVPMRSPPEFHNLLKRWQTQASNKGYNHSLTDIQQILAHRMNRMNFRPDMDLFKEKDLYDTMFPVRNRRVRR